MTQTQQLNQLLSAAKEAEATYQDADSRRLESKGLYRQANVAWQALHDAMRLVGKFNVIAPEGEDSEIRTIGLLVDRTWIWYSDREDSRYTFSGVNLTQISRIEEATQ